MNRLPMNRPTMERPEHDAVLLPGSAGSAVEVLSVFLRLGCLSFGGPVAHLGYFQKEFVERRRWCDQDTYAELIALAQSLPGPSSSQVCFGLGVLRAGWLGGLSAWIAFTLPSALLMLAFALGASLLSGQIAGRLIHGLALVAVAVVAQAVLTMQRSLAPDLTRLTLALLALAVTLFAPPQYASLLAIAGGGVAGLILFRSAAPPALPVTPETPGQGPHYASKTVAIACLAAFFLLLILLPVAAQHSDSLDLQALAALYRTGALVFGGGHVVLPLLEDAIVAPGWVSETAFLSGYGVAQALPGPLFSFAAFLGASVSGTLHPALLGVLGLCALSAPGLLAMAAVLPFWKTLRSIPAMYRALRGINAAVVGILIAALYTPLWTSTIRTPVDFLFTLVAFSLLIAAKAPPWLVVVTIPLARMLAG